MRPILKPLVLALALSMALASGLAAEVQPLGPELQLNAEDTHRPRGPVALFAAGGGFTVVWENEQLGIRARRFSAAGDALGGDLDLVPNARLAGSPSVGPVIYRSQPAAAGEASGGFVLTWSEERSIMHLAPFHEWREVQRRDVFAQRFNPAGQPLGARFRISPSTGALHQRPAVAGSGNEVLVVWEAADGEAGPGAADGIFARLINRDGELLTGAVKLSGATADKAARAAVAANADGTFLVAWDACCDGDRTGVFARLLDADGAPLGAEFRLNSRTAGYQNRPAVAANEAGEFLVAWQGSFEEVLDSRIWGQVVDAGGSLLGPELQVSLGEHGGDAQVAPAVAALPGGGWFVAWIDYRMPFPIGAFGVELDALGSPAAAEIEINDRKVGSQFKIFVAARGQGDLLVTYEGFLTNTLNVVGRHLSSGGGRSQALTVR